jgi:hypothetical protein
MPRSGADSLFLFWEILHPPLLKRNAAGSHAGFQPLRDGFHSQRAPVAEPNGYLFSSNRMATAVTLIEYRSGRMSQD